MILTALLFFVMVSFAGLVVWVALGLYDHWKRNRELKRVTVPAVDEPFPEPPKMVGLSKTLEDVAADQAAVKLAADIGYALFTPRPTPPRPTERDARFMEACDHVLEKHGEVFKKLAASDACTADTPEALNAMFGYYDDKKADDDWSTVMTPPKPKKKRKAKKKVSRVGKARRKGPRAKR